MRPDPQVPEGDPADPAVRASAGRPALWPRGSEGRLAAMARHLAPEHAPGGSGVVSQALSAAQTDSAAPEGRPQGAAGPERAGRAWHYATFVAAGTDVTADSSAEQQKRDLRRSVRFAQRHALWQVSRLESVRKCGRVRISEDGRVGLKLAEGRAHFSDVATCGSIWACPVCSGKIRNHKAEEVSRAAAEWDRQGGDVLMAAFTAPHTMRDRLDPLFETVAGTFREILQSRAWRKLKAELGILGQIRAVEVTHGENGWHPHIHVLFFAGRSTETSCEETTKPGAKRRTYRRTYDHTPHRLDDAGIERLHAHLRKAWGDAVEAAGYRRPSDAHGVDLQRCASAAEAGEYISKTQDGKGTGNEMARGDLKSGRKANRTPFEILDDFRWNGDAADLALWGEYEQATKGRQAIAWSKGLRKILLGEDDDAELSDEEIAAAETGGETIAQVPGLIWKRMVGVPGLLCWVLEAAEAGGLAAVNALLVRFGLDVLAPYEPDPPPTDAP